MEANQSRALFIPKFEPVPSGQVFLYPWPMQFQAPMAMVQSTLETVSKKYKRTWSREQVEELYTVAKQYSSNTGKDISQLDFSDFTEIGKSVCRTPRKCMSKIMEIQASGTLRSGVWSQEEDRLLKQFLSSGKKKWGSIANEINSQVHKGLKIRTGKQCKERWNNHLNPCINRGIWTAADDLKLLECYKRLGNRWSMIAKELNSRTDSSIKNRIKSLLNKERQNVDSQETDQDVLDSLILRKKKELMTDRESASPATGSFAVLSPQKPSFSVVAAASFLPTLDDIKS